MNDVCYFTPEAWGQLEGLKHSNFQMKGGYFDTVNITVKITKVT